MKFNTPSRRLVIAATFAAPQFVLAAPDTTTIVVNPTMAVGSFGITSTPTLATFAYVPTTDQMYITHFGPNTNQDIRRIDNVSGTQSGTRLLLRDPSWYLWSRTNANFGGGSPTPSSILLNPKQIGSLAPYSNAWILDSGSVVTDPASRPDLTKRIYRYDLQVDANFDASDNFTTLMTLADYKLAAGGVTTNSTGMSRQHSWSGDGQKIYWIDSSNFTTGTGGLWKMNALGGAPTLLLDDDLNTEMAVTTDVNNVDTLYFAGGGTTGNAGGLDKITYDGTTASARTVFKTKAQINDFLETTNTINTRSMSVDADGNIYFNNVSSTAPERRGIYRLDPQGRFSRVLSQAERVANFTANGISGSPTSDTLRMQPRVVQYTNGSATFDVTQILFAELGGQSIAGVYVFKPGDFNRDNLVDQSDVSLFKSKLTARGVAVATVDDQKYDLNGNNSADWKDVKILQQFYSFRDGDANIDLSVDSTDFNALLGGYGKLSAALWTEGDFDGDQKVTTTDFNILAGNFGLTPPPLPGATLGSVVPEPAAISAVALGSVLMFARRRTR